MISDQWSVVSDQWSVGAAQKTIGVNFMSLNYNKKLIPRAKGLRKYATRQEKHLWYDFLSTYPIRFQRQKTIGNYIVDFYCHQAKLVIEVDGSQHYTAAGISYDQIRTAVLNSFGLQVVRFRNHEIESNFSDVCHAIDDTVAARVPSTPPVTS